MPIKKCNRCGQKVPHHSKFDNICMTCEMMQYYPNDENAKALIGTLQANEITLDVLGKTEEILKETESTLAKLCKPFKFFS